MRTTLDFWIVRAVHILWGLRRRSYTIPACILVLCLVTLAEGGRSQGQEKKAHGDGSSGKETSLVRSGSPVEPAPTPSTEAVEDAIIAAAGYLVRACKDDGSFVYCVNLNPEVTPRPGYNLLRHAGAMYALAMFQEWRPDPRVLSALTRAAGYLRTHIGPFPGNDEILAVWSTPEMTLSGSPLQAKLGGTALALAALVGLEGLEAGTAPLSELRGLARFLIFMQREDGLFCSKFVPSAGREQCRWESLYYPGEAALALSMLYSIDPDPRWYEASEKALMYLAKERSTQSAVPADHWALLATADLLSNTRTSEGMASSEALRDHARRVCESILDAAHPTPAGFPLQGSFLADGRTTPTATRLEGLIAALEVLPGEDVELRRRIERVADEGIGFLLRAQVREGPYRGGIPRAIHPPASAEPAGDRTLNRRVTEIRIDYVQHALSAMIQYSTRSLARNSQQGDAATGALGPSGERLRPPPPQEPSTEQRSHSDECSNPHGTHRRNRGGFNICEREIIPFRVKDNRDHFYSRDVVIANQP